MTVLDSFDVRRWVSENREPAPVRVSQPVQLACYTRESSKAGGKIVSGSTAGGRLQGRSLLKSRRNRNSSLFLSAGLLPVRHLPSTSFPIDLNSGFEESYTRKDETAAVGIEPVINALLSKEQQSFSGCDVCTFRNNLNKVALTLLSPKDSWAVDACLFEGRALFLDIRKQQETSFPNADLFCYYGYKFEALCTGTAEVDASSEFCSIVRLKLGSHSLFMAAEVDAFEPAHSRGKQPGLESYVELKTYKIPKHRGQDKSLKSFKHPRWWIQSFLAGIQYLVLGGRDEEGQLRTVDKVKVNHLHQLSEKAGCSWQPNAFLRFLDDALSWMRHTAGQHSDQHLRFAYAGETGQISCTLIGDGDLPGRLSAALSAADSST